MTDTQISTPVAAAEVTAPTAAPRPTTADDLLEMYDAEAKESSTEDDSNDGNPPVQTTTEGDTDGSKETSEEENKQEGTKEGSQEVKAFKAKLGESEVSIPEEAVIMQKIGNKEVPVKVADAVKAFVGQEEFNRKADRRMNDIGQKERAFENERATLGKKAAKIQAQAEAGNWIPVIKSLAKMAAGNRGVDPVEIEKKCIESLSQIHEVYTKMTPEQRDAYFAKRAAESARAEANQYKTQIDQTASVEQVKQEIAEIQQKFGIGEELFWGRWKTLAETMVGDGKKFATIEDIQPENVIEFHQDIQLMEVVDSALETVNPELVSDSELAFEVWKIAKEHPEFDAKDIETIVRNAVGANSQSVENLNRKVEKARSTGNRTQFGGVSSNQGSKKSDVDKELEEDFFGFEKRAARMRHLR